MTQQHTTWEDKIYDILYKNSIVNIVRVLHEDEWPVDELAELIAQARKEEREKTLNKIIEIVEHKKAAAVEGQQWFKIDDLLTKPKTITTNTTKE